MGKFNLKDEHLMREDSLIFSNLTRHQSAVVRDKAEVLREFEEKSKARRAFVKSLHEKNVEAQLQGCAKCRARWENPHADFHLTAYIDDSKI